MKIEFATWVIVTRYFPIMFGTKSGELTDDIKEAVFHTDISSAEGELSNYDTPDDFEVRKLEFVCDL